LRFNLRTFHIWSREECCEDGDQNDPDHENDDIDLAFLDDRLFESGFLQDDVLLLRESDIPGASLNGKRPMELNGQQLK